MPLLKPMNVQAGDLLRFMNINFDRDNCAMPGSCHSEERSDEESPTTKHGLSM